jgi:cholinesterase
MRSKSSEEIMSAYSGISFGPSMDSKFFYKNYGALLAAGKFAQKPTLVGHTESEWDSYRRRSIFPAYDAPTATTNKTAIKKLDESLLLCTVARLAKARVERKIPTWVYSYAGDFPNQKTSPNMTTGPWHGSEVGLIFGTTEFTRKLPDTQEQAELGKKMREAWTSFAKAPVTGLDELKWPRYNPSGMFRLMGLRHTDTLSIYCCHPWWEE